MVRKLEVINWVSLTKFNYLESWFSTFGDPDNHGGQYGPFDVTYLIFLAPLLILATFHPSRRDLRKIVRLRVPLVLMAAVIVLPLFTYGVNQGLIQRNSWTPNSDPHHNSHWLVMAELASFTIPLAAGGCRAGWSRVAVCFSYHIGDPSCPRDCLCAFSECSFLIGDWRCGAGRANKLLILQET